MLCSVIPCILMAILCSKHQCHPLLQMGKLRHRELSNMSKVIQLTKGKATFFFPVNDRSSFKKYIHTQNHIITGHIIPMISESMSWLVSHTQPSGDKARISVLDCHTTLCLCAVGTGTGTPVPTQTGAPYRYPPPVCCRNVSGHPKPHIWIEDAGTFLP